MVPCCGLIEPRQFGCMDRGMMTCSRRNGLCIGGAPARRNDNTLAKTSARLDPETEASNGRPKLSMLFGFLRINTDDQNAGRNQEMHQPFQRGFQCSGRVPRPVNQRNVVLAARKATCRRCGEAAVSSAVQLEHTPGRLRSG